MKLFDNYLFYTYFKLLHILKFKYIFNYYVNINNAIYLSIYLFFFSQAKRKGKISDNETSTTYQNSQQNRVDGGYVTYLL